MKTKWLLCLSLSPILGLPHAHQQDRNGKPGGGKYKIFDWLGKGNKIHVS